MKTILVTILISFSAMGSDRPFWTEKSSYTEGDKVYFVGVATQKTSLEQARLDAAEHARKELGKYLQAENTKGLTLETQMTFEENQAGKVTVYRLMYTNQNDIAQWKEQASKPKVITKYVEKKAPVMASPYANKVLALNAKAETLVIGMSILATQSAMGERYADTRYCKESNTLYLQYGSYWLIFENDVLACRTKVGDFKLCMRCS